MFGLLSVLVDGGLGEVKAWTSVVSVCYGRGTGGSGSLVSLPAGDSDVCVKSSLLSSPVMCECVRLLSSCGTGSGEIDVGPFVTREKSRLVLF